jgi:hypothetical protein
MELWVATPLTPDAESYFVFDKRNTRSRFTAADARLAGRPSAVLEA